MASNEILELHLKVVKACTSGDISLLHELSKFKPVLDLIKGDVIHSHKSKFGDYRPGEYVYIASKFGFTTIVHHLLQFGGNGNILCRGSADNQLRTPLQIACEKGFIDVVKVFYCNGIPLHPDNKFNASPIYSCTINGNLNILEFIVDNVKDILLQTTGGEIGRCPHLDYTDIWASLTKTAKENDSIIIGNLLLYVACIKKHLPIVKYLVRKGVSVNVLSPQMTINSISFIFTDTLNLLSAACKNEDEEMASFLLQNNAEFPESAIKINSDFIGKVLSRYYKDYKRPYNVSQNAPLDYTLLDDAVAMFWDTMGLPLLDKAWIKPYASRLCHLEIQKNKISWLPDDFFECLVNLEVLNVSSNELGCLPSQGLESTRLLEIDASCNQLSSVPLELFMNPTVFRILLSSNQISFLPPVPAEEVSNPTFYSTFQWKCVKLKFLNCSRNKLMCVPEAMKGAVSLKRLSLSDNRMEVFDLTWNCPLMDLNLSKNDLKQFSCKAHLVWSKSLIKLNLSHNNLVSISTNICQLEKLQELKLCYNKLRTLPPPRNWTTRMLQNLNLSNNMLYTQVGNSCEFPDDVFENCLQVLDLSNNLLEIVPPSLCRLKNLNELYLSNNSEMKSLPVELGNLKKVSKLMLTNLQIQQFPIKLDDRNHAKTVLPYLRSKLRKMEPFNRMKLMLIGLQDSGKTTLIATLQGKKPPPNVATDGVKVEQWSLRKPALSFFRSTSPDTDIIFSSWDLAGQHVYYSTHQCFLTGKTLYLAVYKTILGTDGVNNLESWLLNIQARAPDSKVIVVGTHIDQIPGSRQEVLENLENLQELIYSKYQRHGFPTICGCIFVSNTRGDNLQLLRDVINKVATSIIEDETLGGARGSGKCAPRSYIQLYNSVVKESERRRAEELIPILTTDEMLELASSNPDNDIIDVEELYEAAAFLHDNGILLHFNDHLRDLNTSFFIDPSWVCDMLASVVTVKEKNPRVQGGYVSRGDLIRSCSLPQHFIPQYIQLLERFEIVLSLNENTFLIPCMLPKERPLLLSDGVKIMSERHSICRNYHMNYIPAGFWSRLIARIIVAVHKWGMVLDTKLSTLSDVNDPEQFENHPATFWREGVIVFFKKGCFLVEYFEDEILHEDISNKGVSICIWSEDYDFSVMGFIIDHLDSLITEWYPGLEESDGYSTSVIQKLIPCPTCCLRLDLENSQSELSFHFIQGYDSKYRNPIHVKQFDLAVCAVAATDYTAIHCKKHENEAVLLKHLVPDLLLSELPANYIVDQTDFEFEACDETKLGSGGAGGVYLGKYKNCQVAVKQLHKYSVRDASGDGSCGSTQTSGHSTSVFFPSVQTFAEKLQDSQIVKAYWDLRQEVAMLCRLQHPNIVKFLGVSHSPLCFLLELAPRGSLYDVLEKERRASHTSSSGGGGGGGGYVGAVLGRTLTHKIAYQVAQALAYLHEAKIIYRDLKSDNILVWSLEEEDKINIKLSDYGISAFATPQGVIGESGTPGFQAPEIRRSCPYDSKVDIFSYGMWLCELISGKYPYYMYGHSSEIKKAILRGERPDLRREGINPGMPYLEILMKDCWQELPKCRPTSDELVSRLDSVDVAVVERVFPLQESVSLSTVSFIIPLPTHGDIESNTVLLWCGKGSDRRYKLIDIHNEKMLLDLPCPGPRVSCALVVGDLVWLGTEGKQIEIMSKKTLANNKGNKGNKSNKGNKLSVLWSISLGDDCIDMILYEKDPEFISIFASLADGKLYVFKKNKKVDEENADIEERDKWTYSQVFDGTPSRSSKWLCLTRNDSEVWVSHGKTILIIDPTTCDVISSIEGATTGGGHFDAMTTDGQYCVWISQKNSSYIVQFDVESRALLHQFSPSIKTLGNKATATANVETSQRHLTTATEDSFDEFDEFTAAAAASKTRGDSDASIKSARGDAASSSPDTRRQGSVCYTSFNMDDTELNSEVLVREKLCKRPSLSHIECVMKSDKKFNVQNTAMTHRNGQLNRSTGLRSHNHIRSILFHDQKIYIGRSCGDILILNASRDYPVACHVISRLTGCLGYEERDRTVKSLLSLDNNNKVLSSVRIEPARSSNDVDTHQLLLLEVWDQAQFDLFNANVLNHRV